MHIRKWSARRRDTGRGVPWLPSSMQQACTSARVANTCEMLSGWNSPGRPAHTQRKYSEESFVNPRGCPTTKILLARVCPGPRELHCAELLDSGPLPGIRQTSVRAEPSAVHRAIRIAVQAHTPVQIWSACLSIVRRSRPCLVLKPKLTPRMRTGGRSGTIFRASLKVMRIYVSITKVAAHCEVNSAGPFLEEWCSLHNSFADHAAGLANENRPPAFWDVLRRHVQACLTV